MLVKCAECGNEMSSEAVACARCGKPAAKVAKAERDKKLGAQILAFTFLGIIGWGCWTFYRALTGADLVGTTCTMRLGKDLLGGPDVPLFPTADEATRAYGAGLMGRATEKHFATAKWITAGTTATIQERTGSAYQVTTIRGDAGWVATALCQR